MIYLTLVITLAKTTCISDLQKFGSSFKLKTPVPADMISLMTKNPQKQEAITDQALMNAKDEGWN